VKIRSYVSEHGPRVVLTLGSVDHDLTVEEATELRDVVAGALTTHPNPDITWALEHGLIEFDLEKKERSALVAHLLINDVVWVGWPREDVATESLFVSCNDTFVYASSDLERLRFADIPELYQMWRKDPKWGPTAWCVMKRKERPIKPVEVRLRERGYDVDAWGLRDNTSNAEKQATLALLMRKAGPAGSES
jgi:hypothetical protein